MSSPLRQWTAEEENLMLRQSLGQFSMFRLEKALRSSREAIINRMLSLGLQPVIQKKRGSSWPEKGVRPRDFEPEPVTDDPVLSYAPTVGDDKLLQRLQTLYPDRRFEDVDFAAIKKRTAG